MLLRFCMFVHAVVDKLVVWTSSSHSHCKVVAEQVLVLLLMLTMVMLMMTATTAVDGKCDHCQFSQQATRE